MLQLIHSSIYDAAYTDDQPDGHGALLVVTYRDKGGIAMRGYHATKWANRIKRTPDQADADEICELIHKSTPA